MAELLSMMISDMQPTTAGRRALLMSVQLFAFLLVFGARERYVSTTSINTLRTAAANASVSIEQTGQEVVQDFFDTENCGLPAILTSNRSSIERSGDYNFGLQHSSVSYSFMLEEHPNFRTSPYELRFPDEALPHWAKKHNRTHQSTIPAGKHVCFAHVGKTGGSTLGCSLGFSLHCRKNARIPGVLPLYTTNVVHNDVNDCPDGMPYYLFPVRNPLDRLKSAYVYDRPQDPTDQERKKHGQFKLYLDCPFYLLENLASTGLAKDGNASAVCKERAIKTIQGTEQHGYHLYFNYRWFVQNTLLQGAAAQDSKILVIRSEHMVEDWNRVEQLLESDAYVGTNNASTAASTVVTQFEHDNPSAWKAVKADSVLSERSRQLLCHYLCDEIQVYKWLLYQSVNLDDNDFVQSMKELRETCPEEAVAKSCSQA